MVWFTLVYLCVLQVRGFGHVGFLVQDLDAACAYLEEQGVTFKKRPAEGNMRGANVICCIFLLFFLFQLATQSGLTLGFSFEIIFHSFLGLAFAYDPDGYWVEIIQRGGISMLDM